MTFICLDISLSLSLRICTTYSLILRIFSFVSYFVVFSTI